MQIKNNNKKGLKETQQIQFWGANLGSAGAARNNVKASSSITPPILT